MLFNTSEMSILLISYIYQRRIVSCGGYIDEQTSVPDCPSTQFSDLERMRLPLEWQHTLIGRLPSLPSLRAWHRFMLSLPRFTGTLNAGEGARQVHFNRHVRVSISKVA